MINNKLIKVSANWHRRSRLHISRFYDTLNKHEYEYFNQGAFVIKGSLMFVLDEKVVYPGHGVAKISRILEKKIAGHSATFFELKFLNKDMTILVPTDNLATVGVRRLSSLDNINDIFKILSEPFSPAQADSNASNWNKRNKEYQCKLRTGNLRDICKIYRDLTYIATYKELSFGEKNLLQQTELLLAQEISLVNKTAEDVTISQLRSLCAPAFKLNGATGSVRHL